MRYSGLTLFMTLFIFTFHEGITTVSGLVNNRLGGFPRGVLSVTDPTTGWIDLSWKGTPDVVAT